MQGLASDIGTLCDWYRDRGNNTAYSMTPMEIDFQCERWLQRHAGQLRCMHASGRALSQMLRNILSVL